MWCRISPAFKEPGKSQGWPKRLWPTGTVVAKARDGFCNGLLSVVRHLKKQRPQGGAVFFFLQGIIIVEIAVNHRQHCR
jgi:hypothetical protein